MRVISVTKDLTFPGRNSNVLRGAPRASETVAGADRRHVSVIEGEIAMTSATRRRFLQHVAGFGLGTFLPLGITSAVYAFPWVVIGLAAGSFVAGMIANHNRRNI